MDKLNTEFNCDHFLPYILIPLNLQYGEFRRCLLKMGSKYCHFYYLLTIYCYNNFPPHLSTLSIAQIGQDILCKLKRNENVYQCLKWASFQIYNIIKQNLATHQIKMDRLKIKPKLSQSPSHIYRVRPKGSNKMSQFPQIEIRETLVDSNRGSSLSPAKIRRNPSGLFKNAHQIQTNETYLNQKIYKLSNTNESSSPQASNNKEIKLLKPINCTNNNRSMSTSNLQHAHPMKKKVIQRTVSIVIDGKNKDIHSEEQLLNSISQLVLGEDKEADQFVIQYIDESSIHGDKSNFFGADSNFITDIINPQNYSNLKWQSTP